ncbi:hypothetical protein [Nonomuraea sp. NPDC049646]|uniref:hypothetical protein n=1 Tax=unclassified Nonomuraea TaxID=2593643 RepID=UPI003796B0C9
MNDDRQQEEERRRAALIAEAAELGLTLVRPAPYVPEYVQVRLEGRPRDIETTIDLLVSRGINLATRSEDRPTRADRVETWFTLHLDRPGNQPDDAMPAWRVLWKPGDDMIPWDAMLLRWDDPAQPIGRIRRPWRDQPPPETLPAPLLDEQGREIGQVLQAVAEDEGLKISGLLAADQLHEVMRAGGVDSYFRLRPSKNDDDRPTYCSSRDPVRELVDPWRIPAVRLSSRAPHARINVVFPPKQPAGPPPVPSEAAACLE